MADDEQMHNDASAFFGQATAPDARARDRGGFVFSHGRMIQARLFPERDLAACSTLVRYNEGWDEPVLFRTVAEFNAYHLFHGGYCLVADEDSGSLYVNQNRRLSTLDAAKFSSWLEDFGHRAGACARWYAAARTGNATGGMEAGSQDPRRRDNGGDDESR